MGDFQRSRSKVWWSSFADGDEELAGPASSISRVSSSSPSSSHKSQDSGFSDSETNSSPSSNATTPSPGAGKLSEERLPTLQESSSVIPAEESVPITPPTSESNASVEVHSPATQQPADLRGDVLQNESNEQSSRTSRKSVTLCENPNSEPRPQREIKNNNLKSSWQKSSQCLSLPPIEYIDLRPIQNPSCLDSDETPGPPTHTSTPKASSLTVKCGYVETPTRAGGSRGGSTVKRLVNRRLDNSWSHSGVSATTEGKKLPARGANQRHKFNSPFTATPNPVEDQGPLQHWLEEIGLAYEAECMTTLQSKSLAYDLNRQVAKMSEESTSAVRALQEQTHIISTEFAKLVQQLEYGQLDHVGPLVQSLVGNIVEFLYEHGNKEKTGGNSELVKSCDKLRRSAAAKPMDTQEIMDNVTALGQLFTAVVDTVLTRQIKTLVSVVEAPSSEMALRVALTALTALGLDGAHLSGLVSACGGVRAMLTVCLEAAASSVRASALRALATVCCVSGTIRQLEQAGGIEVLAEILSEESRPEPELSEAAAVLAQITAPWVEDNHSINGLAEHLPILIKSLTHLVNTTRSNETLLLASAALANVTFMEPQSVWPLLEHNTAGALLAAVRRRGAKASVFLQEQAATLLANMAAVPESRGHLAEQQAVVALLCFLQIRHSPLQRAPEIAAAERVQQKSAIALSRLCSDPQVAQQIVQLQGVSRLVRLCKEERERNHSDGVLVACLAALRKIAANCGSKVIEDLDATELVEPRLLDSFLIYSSRQESYV